MSSSRISWSSFHACCSSAVNVGGLSGSSLYLTNPVGSLLIAICPSCRDQADSLSTVGKNNREDRLSNSAQHDPPLLFVFAGEVRKFNTTGILECLASDQKRNLVLAQVDLSLYRVPLEFHAVWRMPNHWLLVHASSLSLPVRVVDSRTSDALPTSTQ